MIDASLTAGDLGHAFSGYLYLLQGEDPGCKDRIRDDFATVLHQWAEHQEAAGRREDALWCYEVARRLWPENAEIHNSMGVFLHRLGQDEEAASCFRLALEIDPGFAGAQKNLSNIVGSPFQGWHFPMLNDKKRNVGYQTAIAKAVTQGHDRVLDIGSGTGLLSVFAVNAGAKSVFACEESQDMVRLSHDVLAANQMQDRVQLLHKLSTDMKVPEDIPNRVTLVVTEIFDAGLFGEGAVSTLQHAWKHLLLPPKASDSQPAGSYGRVIPAGATVFAQVVQCQHIRKQYRVLNERICNLNVRAVRFGTECQKPMGGNREEKGTSQKTSETSENLRKPHSDYQEEPYTSERISEVPLSYKALTPAMKVLEIDFNDPQILSADHATSEWKHMDFPVLSNGRVDAIISWFDLRLDETETLSSSPESASCWEQAVFPVSSSNFPFPQSDGNFEDTLCVDKGATITVAMSCRDECLHLRCANITHHAASKMEDSLPAGKPASSHEEAMESMVTSFEQNLVTSADSAGRSRKENCSADSPTDIPASYTLQPDTISILNDQKFNNACYSAIKNLISENELAEEHIDLACVDSSLTKPELVSTQQSASHLHSDSSKNSSHKSRTSKFSVLDIASSASLTGLFAAKHSSSTRVCFPNSQSETRSLIQTIATANGIEDCVEFGSEPHPLSPSSEATFDVLVAVLVAPCGTLKERVLEDIAVGRVCALKPTGRILPASVSVFAMCIECASLQRDSEVLGTDSTMGVKIDEFINKYKVSTFLDIHLSARSYKQLSPPFLPFHLNLNEKPKPDSTDLPSFVNQTTTHAFEAINDGTITAIPFWFDIGLDASNHVNTLDIETHWRQAAFLLPEGQLVRKGDSVKVTATLENSCLVFQVEVVR
ncbi:protein arginine N-methyltransferase 9-like isoform X2 [Patiria miniata]|nr:protein arginine N-methyltransferase 9-like isoform X2 [Patiria miniata]